MHWIRIDRYFSGEPADAEVVNQPVTCHHCEMAPCESVCPVAATVHTEEGLNDMVYNRCIGTRYCSNNCPYKVRKFNYFNYRKGMGETEKLVQNPEVTVRSRGVMEKCSFCVQRIQNVKIQAKNDQREIADGEITPACAQTCPAQAIIFGDLNDPESRVRKAFEDGRAYGMLAELNVKPRINYLAKLTNPAGDKAPAASHNSGGHH
jgi:molybdopterin-containing oxidoreductase family iron-sulfur binding subunit